MSLPPLTCEGVPPRGGAASAGQKLGAREGSVAVCVSQVHGSRVCLLPGENLWVDEHWGATQSQVDCQVSGASFEFLF